MIAGGPQRKAGLHMPMRQILPTKEQQIRPIRQQCGGEKVESRYYVPYMSNNVTRLQ
ncbi:MAG: hypothetical protein IT552_01190 [Sphingomonadaceae bacterium]|jgi:hypothetical protein|nr:hypothetical protein [Sphingomonadaceae bacterium]